MLRAGEEILRRSLPFGLTGLANGHFSATRRKVGDDVAWLHLHDYLWGAVERNGSVRVRFAGEFDLASTDAAERFLLECVDTSSGPLVLDLSRVTFMDAGGVSFLLRARAYAEVRGRTVSLGLVSRAVARVLDLLDVAPTFDLGFGSAHALRNPRHAQWAEILGDVVERAIALDGAQRGSAQLVDLESGALQLVAAPGFSSTFWSYFETVHDEVGASCGVAAATRSVVPIHDVCASPVFAGTPSLDVMLDDDARACISIPVVVDGVLLGMFSTHHERPRAWELADVRALERLARETAAELVPSTAA